MTTADPVLVVGSGISGVACARALATAGVEVRVLDRGHVAGGRMATRRSGGRPVDIGASYFTASSGEAFQHVVNGWVSEGLAREWTDTFAIAGPDGIRETRSGPMRYAARGGLRSLVLSLADGLPLEAEHPVARVTSGSVDGVAAASVALAMPDPQARRLLPTDAAVRVTLDDGDGWDPVIAVTMGWQTRRWAPDLHGAFVNGSEAISFVADDGDRRGDAAPVLVAHTTASLARQHLADPDAVIATVIDAVASALDIDERPDWADAHRWRFARPATQHAQPFLFQDGIGVCGDGWGPKSSVGGAWSSGTALGEAIAAQLGIRELRG